MQNFMPHYKKQSHAITADGLQFLKDFGKVSNYNGYIQIALKMIQNSKLSALFIYRILLTTFRKWNCTHQRIII